MLTWILSLIVVFLAYQVKVELDFSRQREQFPVGEKDVLKVDIDESPVGASKYDETFVFLHGWPDTNAVWAPTAQQLCSSNPEALNGEGKTLSRRCIRVDLPGYDLAAKETQDRSMGYTFEETMRLLGQTIRKHVNVEGGERFTLIGHDWGACFVHFLLLDIDQDANSAGVYIPGGAKPGRPLKSISRAIKRAVIVDVGLVIKPSVAFSLLVVAYQGVNNLLFVLPRALGTFLLEKVVLPRFEFPFYSGQAVGAHMNWPYRSLWRDLIFKRDNSLYMDGGKRFMSKEDFAGPVLFIYGNDKPAWAQFHAPDYLEKIRSTNKLSQVSPCTGTHWMMITHKSEFDSILFTWLRKTN